MKVCGKSDGNGDGDEIKFILKTLETFLAKSRPS